MTRPTNARSTRVTLPRAEDQPTLTVVRAAAVLGIGKSSAYAAISRGEIPSIRLGGRVLVPTAALRKMVGLDEPVAS
jgi:excisionase family DNA binding protein